MNSPSRAKDIPANDVRDARSGESGDIDGAAGGGPRIFPARSSLLKWVLNLLVAGALLALVLWKVKPAEIRDAFGEFEPWPAALAVVLNLPVLVLMTVRGQFILGKLGHAVGFGALFPISTFGNVLGAFTPAGAGDLLRTPFFRSRHEIPYSHGVAEVLYERGSSVFVLALGTAVAASWIAFPVWSGLAVAAAAIVVLAVAPYIIALVLRWLGPRLASDASSSTSMLSRLREATAVSVGSLEDLLRDPATTFAVAFMNLGVFSIAAFQFWLVGISLDFTLSAAESWAFLGAALLAGIATLLPFGIGTFDVVLASLLSTDQGLDVATAAALLVRATITLPLGLAAVASYLYLMSGGRRTAEVNAGDSAT
jgi:uncharacterized protein (TIRG00374 family)